jgi:prophage regulatory protein
MQDPSAGEEERLLRLKQVLEIIPVSKSSWWAGVKDGKYPASVKYGRSTFWLNSDIQILINHIIQNKVSEDNLKINIKNSCQGS